MAKRFTDTAKWDDSWFVGLSAVNRLAWLYACDKCDAAGVLEPCVPLMKFHLGEDFDLEDFVESTDGRIVQLDSGKLFIRRFIEFQYGKLSEDCKPHRPVFNLLGKHGIDPADVAQNDTFKYGSVTSRIRREILNRDEFQCCYCGEVFDESALQIDHVKPRSKGGDDSRDNLVAACAACNSAKGVRDVAEFIQSLPDKEAASERLSERVSNSLSERAQEKDKEKETDKDKEEGGVGETKATRGKPNRVPAAKAAAAIPPKFSLALREAVAEWLTYKGERRENYTQTGLKGLWREVEKVARESGESVAIGRLRNSIANDHQGWNYPAPDEKGRGSPSSRIHCGPGQVFQGSEANDGF